MHRRPSRCKTCLHAQPAHLRAWACTPAHLRAHTPASLGRAPPGTAGLHTCTPASPHTCESGPCSAWDSRSAATWAGLAAASATTSTSDGPAGMSMDTCTRVVQARRVYGHLHTCGASQEGAPKACAGQMPMSTSTFMLGQSACPCWVDVKGHMGARTSTAHEPFLWTHADGSPR